MFKKKYTKWQPLGNYEWDGTDRIVFVKKNLKTGMMKFKTRKVNSYLGAMSCLNPILPSALIDVKKAWEEIVSK